MSIHFDCLYIYICTHIYILAIVDLSSYLFSIYIYISYYLFTFIFGLYIY